MCGRRKVLDCKWCTIWIGEASREGSMSRGYVVGPCLFHGVVSEGVVWELLIIVLTMVKKGLTAAVPAAMGHVLAGDTPVGVSDSAFTSAVVLAASATDIQMRCAVSCPMTPALTPETSERFLLEFGRANPFSCYCKAVSDGCVGTFCGVEGKDAVAMGLAI